jgi:carboxypeptidase Taq
MLIQNKKIIEIISSYEKIWSLNYLNTLVGWDTETYMPEEGVEPRGRVMSNLSGLIQDSILDKKFIGLVRKAQDEKGLNVYENKILQVLDKQLSYYQKLPKEFVKEYSMLISSASTIWSKAKQENILSKFLPVLEKIFDMTRQRAEYLGYEKDPYEAIFKEYEDDFTVSDLDEYFASMKKFLGKIDFAKVTNKFEVDIKDSSYDKEKMIILNNQILEFLSVSPKNFRIDVSAHPFSLFLGLNDIRMTTNYSKKDFTAALLPTIHEFGHGLFASQSQKELEYTPLWPECSYALHESQSRFWENMISRNIGFVRRFSPDFKELNMKFQDLTPLDFYEQFNEIKPTLIRTQADEITYHYHIMIRYEIERDLLNKNIKISEVPEIWDQKYQKYLGIKPTNYSDGFLQDIHWAFGSIGYFPTYSLGSVTSAIWYELIEKDLQLSKKECFTIEDIIKVKEWLKNNINKYAGTYNLKEITKKVSGNDFSTDAWEKYIIKKYPIFFDK